MVSYVEFVQSNIKMGVDVHLAQKTLLVGPNGAGKTSVLQAITLATGGFVNEHEGLDNVRLNSSLARLFPRSEKEVYSKVIMSDTSEFVWRSRRTAKGLSTPTRTPENPPYRIEFPVQELEAIFTKSKAERSRWVNSIVGSSLSEDELLDLLPSALKDSGRKALDAFQERDPVALAAALKAKARQLRTIATHEEKGSKAVLTGIPQPLQDEEVQALLKRKEELESALHQPGVMDESEYAQVRAQAENLLSQAQQYEEAIAQLPQETERDVKLARRAQAALSLFEAHFREFGDKSCFLCGSNTDLRPRYEEIRNLARRLQEASRRLELVREHDRLIQRATDLVNMIKDAKVVSLADAREEYARVVREIQSNETRKRVFGQHRNTMRTVEDYRALADDYSRLAKVWESRGKEAQERNIRRVLDRFSSFLPFGYKLDIDTSTSLPGIRKGDGPLLTSLSGAESMEVLLALGCMEAPEGSVRVLMPRDRDWDSRTLSAVMERLSGAPCQVILTATEAPRSIPSGWTEVRLG